MAHNVWAVAVGDGECAGRGVGGSSLAGKDARFVGAISTVEFWQGREGGTVLLASGSNDGTIRIWNPDTGDCLGILFASGEAWVAFRPDGRYRFHGDLKGFFWHVAGLCRYELGELDTVHPGLRLAPDEPLIG
jgi:WD40 repeat protein